MVPRSNLRRQLDSLNQALAQSSPSDNFIGPGASYFSVCFRRGLLFVDQPGWRLGLLLYALQQSLQEETHWLEHNRLSDLEGVTWHPTGIYWAKSVSSALSGTLLLKRAPVAITTVTVNIYLALTMFLGLFSGVAHRHTILQGRCYYYARFTGEKTEAWEGEGTRPRSQSRRGIYLKSNPKQSGCSQELTALVKRQDTY